RQRDDVAADASRVLCRHAGADLLRDAPIYHSLREHPLRRERVLETESAEKRNVERRVLGQDRWDFKRRVVSWILQQRINGGTETRKILGDSAIVLRGIRSFSHDLKSNNSS